MGRVLFTRDHDLLAEAAIPQHTGRRFFGVVYARPARVSIGQCVKDLEFLCTSGEPGDVVNTVWHLPILK